MKRLMRAFLITVLLGPYTLFCIALFLLIALTAAGNVVPQLQHPSVFYYGLIVLGAIAIARIFWVQIKKPSS